MKKLEKEVEKEIKEKELKKDYSQGKSSPKSQECCYDVPSRDKLTHSVFYNGLLV